MGQLDQSNYNPSLRYDTEASQSWTTAGNTHTVTDANIRTTSFIVIMHTSAHNGRWYVTISAGSFVITSSDAEETSATFKYLIL